MAEQGDYEEMPEDNLEVLSLTDPDLEQNLLMAASVGELAGEGGVGGLLCCSLRALWWG